jgi:hypothetical protein
MRIYYISRGGQPTRGGPLPRVFGEVLKTARYKNLLRYLELNSGDVYYISIQNF